MGAIPNATTLAEFTLNMPGETVDISGVNGTNAIIAIDFSGQTSSHQWNDGSFEGANTNITKIANQPITSRSPVPGVTAGRERTAPPSCYRCPTARRATCALRR